MVFVFLIVHASCTLSTKYISNSQNDSLTLFVLCGARPLTDADFVKVVVRNPRSVGSLSPRVGASCKAEDGRRQNRSEVHLVSALKWSVKGLRLDSGEILFTMRQVEGLFI